MKQKNQSVQETECYLQHCVAVLPLEVAVIALKSVLYCLHCIVLIN